MTDEKTTDETPKKSGFPINRFENRELAREANRRSQESRKAAKKAREELSAWNALAVKQRAAVTIAKAASAERLNGVLEALLEKAEKGDTRAATEVRAWLSLGASLTTEDEQSKDGELTPSQRAAIRANLLRGLEQRAGQAQAVESEFDVNDGENGDDGND